jgi:hypothetical protein
MRDFVKAISEMPYLGFALDLKAGIKRSLWEISKWKNSFRS